MESELGAEIEKSGLTSSWLKKVIDHSKKVEVSKSFKKLIDRWEKYCSTLDLRQPEVVLIAMRMEILKNLLTERETKLTAKLPEALENMSTNNDLDMIAELAFLSSQLEGFTGRNNIQLKYLYQLEMLLAKDDSPIQIKTIEHIFSFLINFNFLSVQAYNLLKNRIFSLKSRDLLGNSGLLKAYIMAAPIADYQDDLHSWRKSVKDLLSFKKEEIRGLSTSMIYTILSLKFKQSDEESRQLLECLKAEIKRRDPKKSYIFTLFEDFGRQVEIIKILKDLRHIRLPKSVYKYKTVLDSLMKSSPNQVSLIQSCISLLEIYKIEEEFFSEITNYLKQLTLEVFSEALQKFSDAS